MSEIIEMKQTAEGFTASLDDLSKFELIAAVEGKVVAENITKFKRDALVVLGTINTNLVTDNDFVEAKNDIKLCEAVEKNLQLLFDKVISGNQSIKELSDDIFSTKAEFAATRLKIDKLVIKRTTERKKEITDAAIKKVADKLKESPVAFSYKANNQLIIEATKNKKLYSAMETAVDVVADKQIAEITALEETYKTNIAAIEQSEIEFLGLYADKKNLALSPVEVVAAQITSREATARLKAETDARKKREDDDAKAAKEKADKEEADRKAERDKAVADALAAANITVIESPIPEVQDAQVSIGAIHPAEVHPQSWQPPVFDHKPPMPPPSFPNPFADTRAVVLRVEVQADRVDQVIDAIGKFPAVLSVSKM